MGLILPRANKLAFPGGKPGFNPLHPASAGFSGVRGFSAVSSVNGANFYSLTTGASGVIKAGTPTSLIDGAIGPVFSRGSTNNTWVQFAGPGIADMQCTAAAILIVHSTSGLTVFANNNAGGGIRFDIDGSTSNELQFTFPNVAALTHGPALSFNIPYFVAGSVMAAGAVNYVAVNLQTGQVFSSQTTTASSPGGATDATYNIGEAPASSGNMIDTSIAALMYSPTYLSMPQLLVWAQDPWSFWYPNKFDLAWALATPQAAPPPTAQSDVFGYVEIEL